MSGHTPGPWEADRAKCDESGHYYQIDSPGLEYGFPRTVADTMNRASGIDPDEDRTNALLIAAAPELEEALEAMLALPAHPMATGQTLAAHRKALAALVKARGGAA